MTAGGSPEISGSEVTKTSMDRWTFNIAEQQNSVKFRQFQRFAKYEIDESLKNFAVS